VTIIKKANIRKIGSGSKIEEDRTKDKYNL